MWFILFIFLFVCFSPSAVFTEISNWLRRTETTAWLRIKYACTKTNLESENKSGMNLRQVFLTCHRMSCTFSSHMLCTIFQNLHGCRLHSCPRKPVHVILYLSIFFLKVLNLCYILSILLQSSSWLRPICTCTICIHLYIILISYFPPIFPWSFVF